MYAVVIHNNFVELVEAKFLFCKQHKYPVRMVSTHVVINCRGEEKTFSPSHMLWLSIRTLQTFKSLVTIFQTNFRFEMLTFKWIFVCETGDSEVQRTMLELLNQLDGFEATKNIKVVMATNRIDILDSALLRPGRIDRKIEFPPPNEEVRLWGSLNLLPGAFSVVRYNLCWPVPGSKILQLCSKK